MIAKCKTCEKYKPRTTKEPLFLHEMTNLPYQKLACDILDFGGKSDLHEMTNLPYQKLACDILDFGGKSDLTMIDYYSKWLELVEIPGKQTCHVISVLKSVFAIHGIPDVIVADNMPFASYECTKFANECTKFAKDWNFELIVRCIHVQT
ncbi:hypothetical protein QE152_g222 [Popillia japonica]|uniref:Integrase catalytic domain-containing protein n=1 Tax=Popillia japonica TaxID=7064 RepID=A0AAW1NK14_POPJA